MATMRDIIRSIEESGSFSDIENDKDLDSISLYLSELASKHSDLFGKLQSLFFHANKSERSFEEGRTGVIMKAADALARVHKEMKKSQDVLDKLSEDAADEVEKRGIKVLVGKRKDMINW